MKTIEQIRADFEAWARTCQLNLTVWGVIYLDAHTRTAWAAWRAATWQPEADAIAAHWAKGMNPEPPPTNFPGCTCYSCTLSRREKRS